MLESLTLWSIFILQFCNVHCIVLCCVALRCVALHCYTCVFTAACEGQFLCDLNTTGSQCTVECVPKTMLCNGVNNCANGLDETGCTTTTTPAPVTTTTAAPGKVWVCYYHWKSSTGFWTYFTTIEIPDRASQWYLTLTLIETFLWSDCN